MAKQSVDQLKQWFETGDFPNQQQFWDWLDSFRHLDTKITWDDFATALQNVIQAKADLTEGVVSFGQLPSFLSFHNTTANFPTTGNAKILYIDISVTPYLMYVWRSGAYEQLGGSGSGKTFPELLAENNDAEGNNIINVGVLAAAKIEANEIDVSAQGTNASSVARRDFVEAADAEIAADLNGHKSDTANPHIVTLEQARAENNQVGGNIDMNGNKVINHANPSASGDVVNKNYADQVLTDAKSYTDAQVTAIYRPAGDHDASTGLWPTTGTGTGGAIRRGDTYNVTVAGTLGGIFRDIGDTFYANVANPTTDAHWSRFESNVEQATESTRGTVRIASASEAADETSLEDSKAVSVRKLWANFWNRVLAISHTFAAKITFTIAPRLSSTTAGQYLKVDSNKDVESVANIPAADVTESGTRQFVNPSGLSTQYLRGNNTWANFTTDVLATLLAGLTATTGVPAATDSILVFAGKVLNFINNISATVRGTILSGFTVGSNSTITSADTIEQAFGKTQGQINALSTGAISWGFRVSLNQLNNSVRIPFQGNSFQLSSVVVSGGVASVASYQLFKTISATASGQGVTTSIATLNSQLSALNTTEKNNGYIIEILFTFTAGEEVGGAIITGVTS